jgi:hypothetical protein
VSPIFLVSVPLIKPLMLWACQPAAFMISANVAPFGLFSRSMIFAALLPSLAAPASLAALGVYFVALAVLADLVLAGATCAPRTPGRAFFVAFRCSAVAVPVSGVDVMMLSPLAVITVRTSFTLARRNCKRILIGNLLEANGRRCGGAAAENAVEFEFRY